MNKYSISDKQKNAFIRSLRKGCGKLLSYENTPEKNKAYCGRDGQLCSKCVEKEIKGGFEK